MNSDLLRLCGFEKKISCGNINTHVTHSKKSLLITFKFKRSAIFFSSLKNKQDCLKFTRAASLHSLFFVTPLDCGSLITDCYFINRGAF